MQARFLAAYVEIGTTTGAAKRCKINRGTHYSWLVDDPAYADRYKEAHEQAIDGAEQELRRRGVEGYQKPVFFEGKRRGFIREYSDACLIFYLKGRRRDVFGDKREVSGPDGGPIKTDGGIIITYGADESDSRTPPS